MSISQRQVLAYIANAAESIIEDDLNESGLYSDDEHTELRTKAMAWISDNQ